jgi:hypothetical protein
MVWQAFGRHQHGVGDGGASMHMAKEDIYALHMHTAE